MPLSSCKILRVVILLIAAQATSACVSLHDALHTDVPKLAPAIPRGHIDEAASEIRVLDTANGELLKSFPEVLANGRRIIAQALSENLGKGDTPARYLLVVSDSELEIWPGLLCMRLLFLGCPSGRENISVKLWLQVGDQTWMGRGHGQAWMSLYYNNPTGPGAIRPTMALGRAIHDALKHLSQQTSVTVR